MTHIEQVPPYVVWPLRQEVMYPGKEIEDIKLADDEQGVHLALFYKNILASVVSLFASEGEMQFRKFATRADLQGRGLGSELLTYVIQHARQENAARLWCNARVNASGFYKRFGFKETDTHFFKDGFDFIVMELLL